MKTSCQHLQQQKRTDNAETSVNSTKAVYQNKQGKHHKDKIAINLRFSSFCSSYVFYSSLGQSKSNLLCVKKLLTFSLSEIATNMLENVFGEEKKISGFFPIYTHTLIHTRTHAQTHSDQCLYFLVFVVKTECYTLPRDLFK